MTEDTTKQSSNPFSEWKVVSTAIGTFLVHFIYGLFATSANISPYVNTYLDVPLEWGVYIYYCSAVSLVLGVTLGVHFAKPLFEKIGDVYRGFAGAMCMFTALICAYFILEYAPNFWAFLFAYALPIGFGCGLGTTSPILVLRDWMPNHQGFAVGLVASGSGFGAATFALAERSFILLIAGSNEEDIYLPENRHAIPMMFLWLSGVLLCMQLLCWLLIHTPPLPESATARQGQNSYVRLSICSAYADHHCAERTTSLNLKQAFGTKTFRALALFTVLISISMLYVNASTALVAKLYNISNATITIAVSAGNISDSIGRLLWGVVIHKMGYKFTIWAKAISVGTLLCAIDPILRLVSDAARPAAFTTLWCTAYFLVSGLWVILPAAVPHYFGTGYTNEIFGVLNLCYFVASVVLVVVNVFMSNMGSDILLITFVGIGLMAAASGFAALFFADQPYVDSFIIKEYTTSSCDSEVCDMEQGGGASTTRGSTVQDRISTISRGSNNSSHMSSSDAGKPLNLPDFLRNQDEDEESALLSSMSSTTAGSPGNLIRYFSRKLSK